MSKLLVLCLLLCFRQTAISQTAEYGEDPKAGKYISAGDAKLYYEVYGSGPPLLLLHGDTFGYISEFDRYIPLLAKNFKVIVPALRGHGKSEIGTKRYSYQLFAEDALAVLKQERVDSVAILGFSAGATTAYFLAANYPGKIRKVVAMGGAIDTSGYRAGVLDELRKRTGDDYERMLPDLVKARKQLMPKPNSYNELIEKLKGSWLQPVYISTEKLKHISCPVLNIGGDRDEYMPVASFERIHRLIPNSQLAILPNCRHVGLIRYPEMLSIIVIPFLRQE